MNWTNILITIIPSVITAIVTIITVISNNNKRYSEIKKDVSDLQKRVDEHNGYAKLFYENSKELAVLTQRLDDFISMSK